MDFDDIRPKSKPTICVGDDLDDLSVSELTERVSLLAGEIERIEAEVLRKKSSQSAADSVFKM